MVTILFIWHVLTRPFSKTLCDKSSSPNLIFTTVKQAAKDSGVEKRKQRGFSIDQVFMAAVGFCSTGRHKLQFTLGSFHAYLVGCFSANISDSALNKKLRKPEVADFLRYVLDGLSAIIPEAPKYPFSTAGKTLLKTLKVSDVFTIDGTYSKVRKSDKYQCKAGENRYGIGVHALVSVISGVVHGLTITQQACNERLYLQTEKLENVALFADRGYPSYDIMWQLIEQDKNNNVKFLFRFNPDITMEIISAINRRGEHINLTSVTQDIDVSDKDNRYIDLQINVKRPKNSKSNKKFLNLRLVRIYNQTFKKWNYFVTNIGADQISAYKFDSVYRLRWTCEMLYKSIKSFNSFSHSINSTHLMIVLFFLVASLVAHIIKTIVASLMRAKIKSISLLKVHKNIALSDLLISNIAFHIISSAALFKQLQELADKYEKTCLQSHVSKRDRKQLKSYDDIAKILCCDVYAPEISQSSKCA